MPHAKTQSSRPLNRGDEMEMRVARLWFWEGYYSRSGINLKRHYHPEPLLVTDLDLLAYDFGPSLQMRRTIGESSREQAGVLRSLSTELSGLEA